MIILRYRENVHKQAYYKLTKHCTTLISADSYFKYLFTVFLTIISYSNQTTMQSMKKIKSVDKYKLLHEVHTL